VPQPFYQQPPPQGYRAPYDNGVHLPALKQYNGSPLLWFAIVNLLLWLPTFAIFAVESFGVRVFTVRNWYIYIGVFASAAGLLAIIYGIVLAKYYPHKHHDLGNGVSKKLPYFHSSHHYPHTFFILFTTIVFAYTWISIGLLEDRYTKVQLNTFDHFENFDNLELACNLHRDINGTLDGSCGVNYQTPNQPVVLIRWLHLTGIFIASFFVGFALFGWVIDREAWPLLGAGYDYLVDDFILSKGPTAEQRQAIARKRANLGNDKAAEDAFGVPTLSANGTFYKGN
jgi:hypothetical protein